MKAQKLLTTNVQGGFFVPKSVLAGGGSCSQLVDTYTQLNIKIMKPSFRGRASFCGLSVP